MKTVYIREYTWGLSRNVFETLKEAQDFDCYPEDLVRVVAFAEVAA